MRRTGIIDDAAPTVGAVLIGRTASESELPVCVALEVIACKVNILLASLTCEVELWTGRSHAQQAAKEDMTYR